MYICSIILSAISIYIGWRSIVAYSTSCCCTPIAVIYFRAWNALSKLRLVYKPIKTQIRLITKRSYSKTSRKQQTSRIPNLLNSKLHVLTGLLKIIHPCAQAFTIKTYAIYITIICASFFTSTVHCKISRASQSACEKKRSFYHLTRRRTL